MKDNSPVYNPGTSKDPLIIFSPETVAKSKEVKTGKQRNERIKKNISETKNNIKTVKRNKSKRYIMKNKRREELESSDSNDDENISIYKVILFVYSFALFFLIVFSFFCLLWQNQNHSKNITSKCDTESIYVENLVRDPWRYVY